MLAAWFTFVLQPPPPLPAAYDATLLTFIGLPSFLTQSAWKTALLATLTLGLPPLLVRLFPAMGAPTSRKAASWVSALVHHAYVVCISLHCLRSEYLLGRVALPDMLEAVTWTVAYLTTDTLATALPEALGGQLDYLIHHSLAIAMTAVVITSFPARLLRLAPHLWLCEASAFGLGLSWACQKGGLGATLLCRLAEALFLVTFLATRCLNLPVAMYAATANGEVAGPLVVILWAIVAQQFWWAGKALGKFVLPSSSKQAKAA